MKNPKLIIENPDHALKKLMDGNKRYVKDRFIHPDQTIEHRIEVAKEQHPFAIIHGCSDSRVPPEVIFDQGIGDLFVIRVAGNCLDDVIIGSIEYAVEHLGVQLLMVLGHEKCGAVDAAIKHSESHDHIRNIVEILKPAIEKAKGIPGDLLENAVKTNIELIVAQLKSSQPVLTEFLKRKKLKIVGAFYHLDSGIVNINIS